MPPVAFSISSTTSDSKVQEVCCSSNYEDGYSEVALFIGSLNKTFLIFLLLILENLATARVST